MPWASTVWVGRASGVLEGTLDGQLIVFSTVSGQYAGLAGTAASIWSLIAEPTTFGGLVERLVTEYDVSPADCASGVARFLDGLRRQGLVVCGRR